MDRIFGFLRVHVLAYLCWIVAFIAWKDYLTHPHQRLTVEGLAHTTGPVHRLAGIASLPSGSRTGYWLMLEEPRRDFNLSLGLDFRKVESEVHEGSQVTVAYDPEVDPEKSTADAFSFKLGDTEYLDPDILVRSHNQALDKQQRLAIGATLGGFAALALVELIRRKLFRSGGRDA